jgi:hypothetical protein
MPSAKEMKKLSLLLLASNLLLNKLLRRLGDVGSQYGEKKYLKRLQLRIL